MTKRDQIVNDAFNMAIAHIQTQLGVESGDFAALWWDGERENTVVELLNRYYDAEVKFEGIEGA